MATPTPEEQLMLQFMNRARSDPYGEMQLLFNTGQANIDSAISFFSNNADGLDDGDNTNDSFTAADMEEIALSEVEGFGKRAPLAWNENLGDSAQTHNDLMIANNSQSHNLPGEPGVLARMQDAGYVFSGGGTAGENIFGYTQDPLQGHAGYYIDWGFTSTAIQTPAGHRNSILSTTLTETGIAYEEVVGPLPPSPSGSSDLGPYSNTQHFATAFAANPFLAGVVINDLDNDDFYDIGEGLGGITVTATGSGGSFSTTTWSSGGYELQVAPNSTYTVTFSGAALGADQSFAVVMGDENIMLDAETNGTPQTATGSADIITGSIGSEKLVLKGGNDMATGGGGDDIISGGSGNDTATGDAGADRLIGGGGNDSLDGGASDDTLLGGSGEDTLLGGGGNDRAVGGSGDDSIDGGFGYDRLIGGGDNDTLNGNEGQDTLLGQAGLDELNGGEGDDVLWGGDQNDQLNGDAGEDNLNGGADNDTLNGGDDDDRLSGGDGNDSLAGNNDNDKLIGGAGDDTLSGGEGNDTLEAGAGSDQYTGGAGADVFILSYDLVENGDDNVITDLSFDEDTVILRNLNGNDYTVNSAFDLYGLGFSEPQLNVQNIDGDTVVTLIDDGVTQTTTFVGIDDPFLVG